VLAGSGAGSGELRVHRATRPTTASGGAVRLPARPARRRGLPDNWRRRGTQRPL